MIKRTETQFCIQTLRKALDDLLTKTDWHPTAHQIALTRAERVPEGADAFHHGVGDWLDQKTGKMIYPESHFRFLDERLRGTYFEEVYEKVAAAIPEKLARVRLMRLHPRRCYSYHSDDEYRYHLAIWTNPEALVVFEGEGPAHIPADGSLYGFEARTRHTALNGGKEARIHLVFTTYS